MKKTIPTILTTIVSVFIFNFAFRAEYYGKWDKDLKFREVCFNTSIGRCFIFEVVEGKPTFKMTEY